MLRAVQMGEQPSEEAGVTFDDFWTLYPRHEAKKDAAKAWGKIDDAEYVEIVVALVGWRKAWADRGSQFIPLPASWLRGERWTDELPREFQYRPPKLSGVAKPEVEGERIAMPQHVRDAIAKLRMRG